MAVAGQVEPQIDLHLRKGRQLVKDLLGQEARDGKKDAAQQDKADADGFPAREIEHGVDPFAKADPRPRAAPPQSLAGLAPGCKTRSEEHTSELQSLMRISYAVFCLKKKNTST